VGLVTFGVSLVFFRQVAVNLMNGLPAKLTEVLAALS
jgi:hypothetical protein